MTGSELLEQHRAAIVSRLRAVPDVGVVHAYQRYAANIKTLSALYVAEVGGKSQLRGWYVTRTSARESAPAVGSYAVTHQWTLRGFLALDDTAETEVVFDGLVERVRDAFRGDDDLGGVAITVLGADGDDDVSGPQLPEIGPVMFAGVLCHAATLTLATRSYFKA